MTTMRIAVIQPLGNKRYEEQRNVEEAGRRLDEAAATGAQILCLPEGYPGPFFKGNRYDSFEAMQAKAAEHQRYVIMGTTEAVPDQPDHHYITTWLIGPNGDIVGRYDRTTPIGPMVYARWQINYVGADEIPPVFDTPWGKIGVITCGEIFIPELARLLALRGANIIFNPAGDPLAKHAPGWRALVVARAVENNVVVAACQQITRNGESGVGIIAGPDGPIEVATGPGVLAHTVDQDALWKYQNPGTFDEALRGLATSAGGFPGIRNWRRPELFGPIAAA